MSFVVTQRFTRPNTDISWFPLSTAGKEITQELEQEVETMVIANGLCTQPTISVDADNLERTIQHTWKDQQSFLAWAANPVCVRFVALQNAYHEQTGITYRNTRSFAP